MGWVALLRQRHSGRWWTAGCSPPMTASWLWLPFTTSALCGGVCGGGSSCGGTVWSPAYKLRLSLSRTRVRQPCLKSLLVFSFGQKNQILPSSPWWEVYINVFVHLRSSIISLKFPVFICHCSWKCHEFKDSSQHIINSTWSLVNKIRDRSDDGLRCQVLSMILLIKACSVNW